MEYISVKQFAEKYGISERTARNYCTTGRIEGAYLVGKTWNIPSEATLPKRNKTKVSPLLIALREQKESKLKGGIFLSFNDIEFGDRKLQHIIRFGNS